MGSLVVRIEYENAHFLYMALHTNHRCPGEWGFFVTRAPAPVVPQPPAVPPDQAADPQRPVVRRRGCRGHGRGEQQFSHPKPQPEDGPSVDESSAVSTTEFTMPALHDLGCADIPTLIVPKAYRTRRPAESTGAPRLAAASPAPSWDEAESYPRLATPFSPDSSWDDVARPHTAPPQEIPCRHTFIHYSSQPTPAARRHRSLSAPALPLPNREWDLDFARQTANVPLSRCATPKPDFDAFLPADAAPGGAPVVLPPMPAAPALPAALLLQRTPRVLPESLAAAAPASPLGGYSLTTASPGTKTPPRKSPQLPPEGEIESPARSSPWKSTHRGSRGGRKSRGKKAAPEAQPEG